MGIRIKELEDLGWTSTELLELLQELQEKLKAEMSNPSLALKQNDDKGHEAEMFNSKGHDTNELDLDLRIHSIFMRIGMPANLSGYKYANKAIKYILKNQGASHKITTEIYPMVAKDYGTTPIRVERGIRHAIELTWERGNIEVINELFGATVSPKKGRPTNSEFVAMIAKLIDLRLDEKT